MDWRPEVRLSAPQEEELADSPSRHALMVAFHFPPFAGSSGFLRTTCFCRHLEQAGWDSSVLTADTQAYPEVEPDNLELAAGIDVHRSFALDARRHLSWRGRYLRLTALPDQWVSWALPAVVSGVRLARKKRSSVVWSTFPIPTALTIGCNVARFTGLPWVVDIRDVIVDDEYPESAAERYSYSRLERKVFSHAAAIVVTTDNAAKVYARRYPQDAEKLVVIRNGFDEDTFARIESSVEARRDTSQPVRLLHSGLLSPVDRNPEPFFDALVELRETGILDPTLVSIEFRASSHEKHYAECLERRRLSGLVKLLPPVAYNEAVAEMMTVDGLMLFQGSTCNHAVPAKVYEYLRCKRPVFVAADPEGETAELLGRIGCPYIADINSPAALAERFREYVAGLRDGTAAVVGDAELSRFSRQAQAGQLADLFEALRKSDRDS